MTDDPADDATPARRERARVQLTDISSRAWEHPTDRGALVALRQLKGFDLVIRRLAGLWNERALRLVFVGSAVRVGDRQFPEVHRAMGDVATSLDAHDPPDIYVVAEPAPRAMALGVDRPFIVLTSGMVGMLDEQELRFVVGHELGHVLSGHALYTTMLMQLLRVSGTLAFVPFGAFGLRAIIAALFEWQRKAELSSDRAGLLACRDPAAALRVHMKLAGGGRLDELDITAFSQQGDEYLNSPDVRDSVLKLLLLEAQSHPFAVARAAELRHWVDSGHYTAILAGAYPRRGEDEPNVREDVSEAARHYRDAFATSQDPLVSLVRDLGGTIAGAQKWIADRFTRGGSKDDEPPSS